MHEIEVKAIRSLAELCLLTDEYDTFLDACPSDTFYLRTGWVESMVDAWAQGRSRGNGLETLFLLLAYREGELIGLMPLQLHQKRKGPLALNRLYGLGVVVGSALSSPAFELKVLRADLMDACFACFRDYLTGMPAGSWDILDLDLIPATSRTLQMADRHWPAQFSRPSALQGVGISMPLGQTFEQFQFGDGKFRSELRRRRRRLLADHGELDVRIDSELTADDWEQLGRLHSKRQAQVRERGADRHSLFEDRVEKSSLLAAMKFAENEGLAIYYRLLIGGRLAAFQLGVQESKNLYLLTMGFDPEFSQYAPFKQLMVAILEDASRRGVTYIDCLPGLNQMKRQFGNTIRENQQRLFVHPSLRARWRYRVWLWGRDLSRRAQKAGRSVNQGGQS